jgi:hypothetical protein
MPEKTTSQCTCQKYRCGTLARWRVAHAATGCGGRLLPPPGTAAHLVGVLMLDAPSVGGPCRRCRRRHVDVAACHHGLWRHAGSHWLRLSEVSGKRMTVEALICVKGNARTGPPRWGLWEIKKSYKLAAAVSLGFSAVSRCQHCSTAGGGTLPRQLAAAGYGSRAHHPTTLLTAARAAQGVATADGGNLHVSPGQRVATVLLAFALVFSGISLGRWSVMSKFPPA